MACADKLAAVLLCLWILRVFLILLELPADWTPLSPWTSCPFLDAAVPLAFFPFPGPPAPLVGPFLFCSHRPSGAFRNVAAR